MTNKILEQKAFHQLEVYIGDNLPGAVLSDTMNKGKGKGMHPAIADAVLEYGGKVYDIEIKASSKKAYFNIRFTHQTMTKAIGKDVIVALISYAGTDQVSFEFFRLSDVASHMIIEPTFLVAKKNTVAYTHPALPTILALPAKTVDVEFLLNSQVVTYTNRARDLAGAMHAAAGGVQAQADTPLQQLSVDQPTWSPYVSDTDEDGEPYPPWLKYPNIPIGSMGWRMGDGEDYMEAFGDWRRAQSADTLAAYVAKYPVPSAWFPTFPGSSD